MEDSFYNFYSTRGAFSIYRLCCQKLCGHQIFYLLFSHTCIIGRQSVNLSKWSSLSLSNTINRICFRFLYFSCSHFLQLHSFLFAEWCCRRSFSVFVYLVTERWLTSALAAIGKNVLPLQSDTLFLFIFQKLYFCLFPWCWLHNQLQNAVLHCQFGGLVTPKWRLVVKEKK